MFQANSKGTTLQLIYGLPDDGTQEFLKHVGDCVSIGFTFQCMQVWFGKFNFHQAQYVQY